MNPGGDPNPSATSPATGFTGPIPTSHPTGRILLTGGDGTAAPPDPDPTAGTALEPARTAGTPPVDSPPSHPREDEDEEDEDFQFLLCEGCGQDSARPRLLGCLHTLCPGCLGDTKQCPLCHAAAGEPGVDNVLVSNLRSRLKVWKELRGSRGPRCGRCRAELAQVWCGDCEEFLCARCLQEHQWWHKRSEHRVRKVEEMRAGSARRFLEETRSSCSLFCSGGGHAQESRVCSIYCPRCERALCCPCALLDTGHAPFRDLRAESRRRQDELHSLRQDLRHLRAGFEAALERLKSEATRHEEQRERLRERVDASAERLHSLVRREAEELRALLDARPERGRSGLSEEVRGVEGTLRRLEAAERLVDRLGRYGGEQELMDLQPFVKAALLRLRRLRPPEPPQLPEPPDFAECRARLRALAERVAGRPGTDGLELGMAQENSLEEDPAYPKIQSVSPSLTVIRVEQPKRPFPRVERGSQVSPKVLKLECDHKPDPEFRWEFQRDPGPSASRAEDAGNGSIVISSSDDSDEDTVVVTGTPEPPP